MLDIRDLSASVEGKPVLKGLTLKVKKGEVHAIMGPNGAGKSTLAKALTGHPACEVTGGTVTLAGQDLLALDAQGRALAGLFLGFQYPVEVPGVNNGQFLRMALNAKRKHHGEEELDAFDFDLLLAERMKELGMDPAFRDRMLNSGYSGGEKKKNEILQMSLLEPKVALLDETDSGLDIDALRVVSGGINRLRGADRAILLITHYQRLLDYVKPDRVHVLAEGRIAKSGGAKLAVELEEHGYDWLKG